MRRGLADRIVDHLSDPLSRETLLHSLPKLDARHARKSISSLGQDDDLTRASIRILQEDALESRGPFLAVKMIKISARKKTLVDD